VAAATMTVRFLWHDVFGVYPGAAVAVGSPAFTPRVERPSQGQRYRLYGGLQRSLLFSSIVPETVRDHTLRHAGGVHSRAMKSTERATTRAPKHQFPEPDQSDSTCPVPSAKIFLFAADPNHFTYYRRLVPPEGRLAIVTDAGRDAVDADVLLTSALKRTAKTCGPDASTLASSLRRRRRRRRRQESPISGESAE
jgi:hypothetical protein